MLTRSHRHLVSFVFTATTVLCSAASLLAQDKQDKLMFVPIRASEVMSAADRQRIGVDRLTQEQRFALDVWLTRYTAEVRGNAPREPQGTARTLAASAAEDGSATEAAESSQQGARRDRHRIWTPLLTVPPAARLVSTPDDGSFVRLGDGTLWEVYPPDRTSTDTWHAGDYITVSLAHAGVGDFDHLLVNTRANTRAFVRFVDVVGSRRR